MTSFNSFRPVQMCYKVTEDILHQVVSFLSIVAEIREADYIVNSMNFIKRDLLAQGENAEYNRAYKALLYRWQYWTLKWKYYIAVCSNCLAYHMVQLV